jgi:excisionase family DNA binding protein
MGPGRRHVCRLGIHLNGLAFGKECRTPFSQSRFHISPVRSSRIALDDTPTRYIVNDMEVKPDLRLSRRLLTLEEAAELLQVELSDLEHLIRTGQLFALKLCGTRKIDSKDLFQLVDTYKSVQKRREIDGE